MAVIVNSLLWQVLVLADMSIEYLGFMRADIVKYGADAKYIYKVSMVKTGKYGIYGTGWANGSDTLQSALLFCESHAQGYLDNNGKPTQKLVGKLTRMAYK